MLVSEIIVTSSRKNPGSKEFSSKGGAVTWKVSFEKGPLSLGEAAQKTWEIQTKLDQVMLLREVALKVTGLKDAALKIQGAEEAFDLLIESEGMKDLSDKLRRVVDSVLGPEEG